ncbi:MAG: hypothetical protein GPI99_21075 [Microcystis aeruginosa W13-15]|jgi:hypothetical protein|nr:hypothetical protein [Microcystis aeruginosa W13-16]NCQ80471.1 hypothetical protein [Microcystis aeruginosa W13-15]
MLSLTSCDQAFYDKQQQESKIAQMRDALEVALEANLKYREADVNCGWFNSNLTSKIIMIPLNKDVIDATVAYKVALENLAEDEKNKLLQKSYQHFLRGNSATFVIMIVNNDTLEHGKNLIYFNDFREDVILLSESQRVHKLKNYDTNLSTFLSPGLNMGYVSFENFRNDQDKDGFMDTYTIRLDRLILTCSNQQKNYQTIALRFDESEVHFVDLIAQGMSKEDIRNKWVAEPYQDVGLKANDVANLLVFVIKIL